MVAPGNAVCNYFLRLCGYLDPPKASIIENACASQRLFFCRQCGNNLSSLVESEDKILSKKKSITDTVKASALARLSECECYQSLTAHQHQKGHTVPLARVSVKGKSKRQLFGTPRKRNLPEDGRGCTGATAGSSVTPSKLAIVPGVKRSGAASTPPQRKGIDKKATPLHIRFTPRKTKTSVKVSYFYVGCM